MKDIFIFINISLEFVTEGPIDNETALIQVMAWHQVCLLHKAITQIYEYPDL